MLWSVAKAGTFVDPMCARREILARSTYELVVPLPKGVSRVTARIPTFVVEKGQRDFGRVQMPNFER